ncbi:MAG: polysaccharide deacetylase family protein [Bacteroidetes bacterium]|nr:polysaccharide deacetylase family protein [Bacteroidota bacterium]MDA1122120.1 polysaccharide deacetylase family protein [Bacteroidota bacterium]
MKLTQSLILCFILSYSILAQTKQVCFSIDDLTVVPYGDRSVENLTHITEHIVNTCVDYHIPAIGFVNETKLYRSGILDSLHIRFLEYWLSSGLELGNHTYSHVDYHKVTLKKYGMDIKKGEIHSKAISKKYESNFEYFRHPYLHIGNSKAKHDSLKILLKNTGYTEAPVTIDNNEYLFAQAYQRALSDDNLALSASVGNDYITYMESVLIYYENLSNKLLGRNMKHILLIHANRLNADYLDQLAEMFLKNGYSFISIQEALTDPAHQLPITEYGSYGISWIDRWALSQGKKGEFFAGYIETPEYINELTR